MADIRIFDTMTGAKETFKPLKEGVVSMYHCGPTVYDHAHIGNLRAYCFADTLRRMFEYQGYTVHQVINITDVGHLVGDGDAGDDKMTRALKREGKPLTLEAMYEVATKYFEAFKSDLNDLNTEAPEAFPRASAYIKENIELVGKLFDKGIAYATSDGVYFDTSKFAAYGKLGNIKIDALKEGARLGANQEKRNPADFALWKFDAKTGWESPWGKGFPGWHIECSSMSRALLGQPFDIHTGAIDLIPTHHNNEIAQSEAAYDQQFARYWMHNEFLNSGNAKMAKSAGGFFTLQSLKDGMISPLAYRYWLMTAHYRTPIGFSFEAVQAAQSALIRLMETVSAYPDGGTISAAYNERFIAAITDDLDMPKAVALVWELVKDASVSAADKRATILAFDKVFGLKLATVPVIEAVEAPPEVRALADARLEARATKDWEKSDALRAEIMARGFEVLDTPTGYDIREI